MVTPTDSHNLSGQLNHREGTTVTVYHNFSTRATPPSQPILGRQQIKNDAGGFVFQLDPWDHLDRFLILGTVSGTYYVGAQELTQRGVDMLVELLKLDGPRVVRRIVEISESGRAAKQDPALFALAAAAGLGDDVTRAAALESVPRVARTGTALFQFLTFVQQFRGWGRGLKTAVARWYDTHAAKKDLDYQLIKYRQRDGWTHRDVLRKAHVEPPFGSYAHSLAWAAGKGSAAGSALLAAFTAAQRAESPSHTVQILQRNPDLPREALRPEHLTDPGVWRQLLENGMPQTALMRNLANMTRVGALKPFDSLTLDVARQLVDPERIRQARLHPFQILVALKTYQSGRGDRGRNTWQPLPQIVDALDAAFYASFQTLEPAGKTFLLGLDVSPSMYGHRLQGTHVTAAEGAAAMAMATAATESHMFVAFTHVLTPIEISPRERLDDVVRNIGALQWNFGGTDAAVPIQHAQRAQIPVDAFVTYTDNETWRGNQHPVQALEAYRRTVNPNAKLVVVGMTATRSTIGDPNDPNTLDVVGFDTATPSVIADFVR